MASRNYYSADNRLMVVQRYDVFPSAGTTVDVGTWEEYWYDALGRRILTRARRDQGVKPDTSHYLCNASNTCGSCTQRTLWDGAQLLSEWRTPESTATGMTSGSVGYVYLDQLDQPIALLRADGTRVLNYTARGLAESSVFVDGSSGDCAIFTVGCTRVDWPAKTQGSVYFTPNLLASGPSGPYTWFGTLADNGGGSTGMLYRRNRYFDPVSGQFTQQDPIGTGGGLNLWGIANGDPVNYSDPFGLCPPDNDNYGDCTAGSSEWYAGRIARGEGNRVLDELGGLGATCAESISCMISLIPASVVGTAVGRVAKALGVAGKASGNVSVTIGSRLEARVAGRLWTSGASPIRGAHGAGEVIGSKSADALRIYRQAQVKPAGHFHAGESVANLVNKTTGGNTHLLIKSFIWW